jgi:hypothetical protein
MTAATITTPKVNDQSIEDLDFAPTCHVYSKAKDDKCDEPAVAFIEFHKVGDCKGEEANARGNMEGNVCQEHLDFFIGLAVELLNSQPPLMATMFNAEVRMFCATCHMPLKQASDILQKVIRF